MVKIFPFSKTVSIWTPDLNVGKNAKPLLLTFVSVDARFFGVTSLCDHSSQKGSNNNDNILVMPLRGSEIISLAQPHVRKNICIEGLQGVERVGIFFLK